MLRYFLASYIVALSLVITPVDAGWLHRSGSGGPTQFTSQLKIGGGGWNTRCATGTNGTRRCRTDTYGEFQWDTASQTWSQLVTQAKMPAANFGFFPTTGTSQVQQGTGGVYSMANSKVGDVHYFMFGNKIFVSTNNGASFTYDNFTSASTNDPNANYRQSGPKMAVDPNNPDHVISGTDQDGIYETLNGTAGASATWTNLSPATIPTATADTSGGAFPSYNVAFDPSAAHNCRAGAISTCTIYIFAYTQSAGTPTGKVWKSTDGGATYTATTSGPTSAGDMVVAPTGGALWVADQANGVQNAGGSLWLYTGTWAQKSGPAVSTWVCNNNTSGNDNCHSIAINPANASIIAVANNGGGINYSSNGGTSWASSPGVLLHTVNSPTVPWMTSGNFNSSTSDIEIGNISYDPSLTDTLLEGGGLGAWTAVTTGTTGATTTAFTGIAQGTEQLVAMEGVAPNGIFVVGNEDKASFYLNPPTSYPTDGANTYQDAFALTATYQIDYAAGTPTFLAQLNTPSALSAGDNSGYSTNGGAAWHPYTLTGAFGANNGYVGSILGSTITNCSPNTQQPIFTVPSTTGLSTWANGSGSIVKIISSGASAPRFEAITVIDGTHIRIDSGFNCSNYGLTSGTNYQLLVSTNPQSNLNGGLFITNVANNGSGLIRVTFSNGNQGVIADGQLCISGVGGTIPHINGCWPVASATSNTADLYGSSFSGSYTVGTGVATTVISQGGYLAVSSPTNITEWPSNQDHPVCTSDGGQTWAQLTMTSEPVPARITNAVWSSSSPTAASFTGSITGTVLTVTGSPTGSALVVGATVFGTGVTAATVITSLGTGTGGVGTYNINNSQTVGSEAMTTTNGQITFTTNVATNIQVGESFNVFGVSPTGYNTPGLANNNNGFTAIAGTSGTTVVGVGMANDPTIANPGAYTNNGVLQPSDLGWSFAYYTFRHTGVADRVTANTFYAYNYLRGIYKHTTCGTGTVISAATTAGGTPAIASNLFAASGAASLLKSVPGIANEMLFAAGEIFVNPTFFHPQGVSLWHTLDGNTWKAVANMSEPIKMDCGAIAPGSDHPTCYVLGWFSGTGLDANGSVLNCTSTNGPCYGLWRTKGTIADWASGVGTGSSLVWARVDAYPLGSQDATQSVIANQTTWNQWAMGFSGSGWAYGQQN